MILNTAQAEWSAGGDFSAYYTDDVGLFAVTRRLSLEEDPTQPIVDEPDQGSDFVYEPNVYINWVTENNLGEFQVSLDGGGYIFNDHSEYSHGFMQFTVGQALTDRTKIKFLYDFIPSLYLGLNLVPEIQEGDAEEHEEVEAGERLNNHILAMHLEHELTDYLTLRALVRYGVRLYDQPFSYRDTQFFTIGPHLVWMITPDIELLVGYHFEQGYTDEDQTVQYQDDIGYINHFTSAELKIRVLPEFFIKATFDYEHNDYTSSYATDIHHNGNENVYQGELEFIYELNESAALIAGWQHGKRKFSYEAHSVKNNNAWIGAEYHF
ncbi:hypothetical protein [Methyloprofundus sp.]|uniref:hypothetical protein n=1 Tax=Methyloprofundus sp. TaxID=2020875 RepID=UPI003D14B7C8